MKGTASLLGAMSVQHHAAKLEDALGGDGDPKSAAAAFTSAVEDLAQARAAWQGDALDERSPLKLLGLGRRGDPECERFLDTRGRVRDLELRHESLAV